MRNVNTFVSFVAATCVALAVSGCASDEGVAPSRGNAEVKVYAITSSDVASVTVTVTGPGITTPIVVELTLVGDQWVANLSEIPAGVDRVFTLSARDMNGVEIYAGVATGVTITSGATAAVSISGQESNPPPAITNTAPEIDSLVATTTQVAQGGTVALAVTAHDDDNGDIITFLWTATGGTLGTPAQASTIWTAPAADGVYRVTARVQDSHGAIASMNVDVTVSAETSSQATIAVTLNQWPEVSSVTSSEGRIDVNESTTLTVVATDGDEDPLAYAWTVDSGCVGAFDDATLASPTFTLGATLPASGTCQLTVVVSDGRSGTNAGSLTVTAAAPPPVNLAPTVTSAVQSLASAAAGQTVNLAVQAEDPEGTALTFTWATTAGTLGTPSTTSGGSQVVWSAPNPITADGQATCTITDATGLSTVRTFTITAIDTTAPALSAFSFTPTSVDVSAAAATVTVTATMTDELSGVYSAGFSFVDPNGTYTASCWIYRPEGAPAPKTLSDSCAVEVPQYSQAGVWKVASIDLYDEAGNRTSLARAAIETLFPTNNTLDVASAAPVDTSAPVLTALSVSPSSIDTASGSAVVTVSFTATDNMSGATNMGVSFRSPSGSQARDCYFVRSWETAPDPLTLTGSCDLTIPQNSEPGVWKVEWFFVVDALWNVYMPTPDEQGNIGAFPATFTVTSGS